MEETIFSSCMIVQENSSHDLKKCHFKVPRLKICFFPAIVGGLVMEEDKSPLV